MPLILGSVFDSTCLLWQDRCTGQRGACWIYNIDHLGIGLGLIGVGVKIFSMFCFFMGSCLYKPPQQPTIVKDTTLNNSEQYIDAYTSNAANNGPVTIDANGAVVTTGVIATASEDTHL